MSQEVLDSLTGATRRNIFVESWAFIRRWPVIPGVILIVLVVSVAFAPVLSPQGPLENNLRDRLLPPIGFEGGQWSHPLGSDPIVRDLLSRVLYGGRISIMVAIVAMVVGTIVGVTLGLIAGYFGKIVDEIIMRIVDIWFALPFLMVALLIAVMLRGDSNSSVAGTGAPTLMVLLALIVWSSYVRYVRAEVLSLKERDYIQLAKVAGASTFRILFWHILPGVINTTLVIATLRAGQLILAEASLSFLGVGVPPPEPTWGSMISDGREYLRDAWWVSVMPGIAIFLLVMSLNFVGDWMRDRFDPRLRQI